MQALNRDTTTRRKMPLWTDAPFFPALLIIGGAFLLGICWSAALNRVELGIIVSHLGAVWSLASNRPVVLKLIFTILFTGIVFAGLACACVYAWNWVKAQRDEEEPEQAQKGGGASSSLLLQEPSIDAHVAANTHAGETPRRVTPMEGGQPSGVAQGTGPETPIPPFTDTSAVEEEEEEEVRSTRQEDERVVVSAPKGVYDGETPPPLLEITLLGTFTITLLVPGTHRRYSVRVADLNAKHQQLIAYVAWPQGKTVLHRKMRDQIYGTDEADNQQVQDALNSGKKEVRRRIDAAVARAKKDYGESVFPTDLDLFALDAKSYWLPSYCRVTDLAVVDAQYAIIKQALDTQRLIKQVPPDVYDACHALIGAYTGNFLEELLVEPEGSIDDYTESWARKPFTLYKHRYLQALFYAGEHLRKLGDRMADDADRQQEYYHHAASLFARGAMAACDGRVFDGLFDEYVSFSNKSGDSPHVSFGEQMVRRAVACYGKIGNTRLADSTYTLYAQQMMRVSNEVWTPQAETIRDINMVREKTGAYRFPDRIGSPFHLSPLVSTESA